MTGTRTLLGASAVLLVSGLTGCGGDGQAPSDDPAPSDDLASSGSAAPSDGGPSFTITSSLDDLKALPHRIGWIARPSLDTSDIATVEFRIDGGEPRWIETNAPYVYGGDESGAHQGFLVSTWLSPGDHRFEVTATSNDGRQATDVAVVRVTAAPAPPAELSGTWERDIADVSGAPAPGSAGNPTENVFPPGNYRMVIDKRWVQVRFPGKYVLPRSGDTGNGWILDSDYTASPTILHAQGPVVLGPEAEPLPAEFGWWCWQDGPSADYTWSVAGDTLTLSPEPRDACTSRSFIWAGSWTRVD